MTAHALAPSYRRTGGSIDPRRALALVGIAALTVAVVVALLFMHETPARPQPVAPTMMVTFITETPPQTAPVPPPPPEPAKPRTQPKMLATPKPTPSAISAPPNEEEPVVDAPVDDNPPAPQVQGDRKSTRLNFSH